jgi:phospholipid transport system transporter-binding protein
MTALALPAVLTMSEASATLASLQVALQVEAQPVIDASGLQTLDTAAVAVLLQCRRLAAEAGKSLKIAGAPSKLAELARLYGVDEVLDLTG